MRYSLFLHHGWFVKNLGKHFIPTNMHTTVSTFFIPVALAMSPLGNGNRSTVLITNQLREILFFYDEILRYLVTVIVAIYPKGLILCSKKKILAFESRDQSQTDTILIKPSQNKKGQNFFQNGTVFL